ncbi:MAG: DUF1801 domain-containing protein [Ginsengibacter sp.]
MVCIITIVIKALAMISKASTPQEYLDELPADKKEPLAQLRDIIIKNLPKGFKEVMSYGMPGYVVPHEIYPAGYHCNPKLPLPFVNIAAQKNFIAVYHMGIYCNPELLKWFTNEYAKQTTVKLAMGKSCLRFKKRENIPYKLIGELIKKVSVNDWIAIYENNIKKRLLPNEFFSPIFNKEFWPLCKPGC